MGKMKSRRQKLHTKAAKFKDSEKKNKDESMELQSAPKLQKAGSIASGPGLFSKVNIDLDMLTRQLNPGGVGGDKDDAQSAITSKSLRGMNLTKKNKRNLKHQYWMKRIDGIQATKQAVKERKKRQKTAVVGDMKPLEDALPVLELLMRDNKHSNTQKEEHTTLKPIKKEKERKKDSATDISIFHQVLKHPAFKTNPKATITEHLHNKIEYENTKT